MQPAVKSRRGFSLLELVVTTAMMALLVTSAAVLLRTSQNAWNVAESGQVNVDAANAALRHLLRQLPQAKQVTGITAADNPAGSLTIKTVDDVVCTWTWSSQGVNYKKGAADWATLAQGIDQLFFEGFKADGVTVTTDPTQIHLVRATVKVTVLGQQQTISSSVWVRKW